jgi:hypothetical protein
MPVGFVLLFGGIFNPGFPGVVPGELLVNVGETCAFEIKASKVKTKAIFFMAAIECYGSTFNFDARFMHA